MQLLWPERRAQKRDFTAEEAGSVISPAPVWPPCNSWNVYKTGPTAADGFQSPGKACRRGSRKPKERRLLQPRKRMLRRARGPRADVLMTKPKAMYCASVDPAVKWGKWCRVAWRDHKHGKSLN